MDGAGSWGWFWRKKGGTSKLLFGVKSVKSFVTKCWVCPITCNSQYKQLFLNKVFNQAIIIHYMWYVPAS